MKRKGEDSSFPHEDKRRKSSPPPSSSKGEGDRRKTSKGSKSSSSSSSSSPSKGVDKKDKSSSKEGKTSYKEKRKEDYSSKSPKKNSSSHGGSKSAGSSSSSSKGEHREKRSSQDVRSPLSSSSASKAGSSRHKEDRRSPKRKDLGGQSPLEVPHPGDSKTKVSLPSSLSRSIPSTSGRGSGEEERGRPSGNSSSSLKFGKVAQALEHSLGEREDPRSLREEDEVDSFVEEGDQDSELSGSSPEHCRPSVSSAMEPAEETPLAEESKTSFRRMIEIIREKCDLPAPPVETPSVTLSRIERRHRQDPQGTAPVTLPISEMATSVLKEMEAAISGPGKKSLASKKSNLLPPMPCQEQRHWYEFLGDSTSSPREISPETADLLGTSKEALQSKGAHLSASEVLVLESLSHNSLKASSWLDYWLDAVDLLVSGMVEGGDAPQELREMLRSGGKAIRYIASQSAALWAASLLFRRDAVLSGVRSISKDQRQRLRNSHILDSSTLFPSSLVAEIVAERQARRDASLFSNVAKLADSAQKAVQGQKATSSAGYSTPHSGYRRKGKKKPTPALPKQADSTQADSVEDQPPQGKGAKRFFPGQYYRRKGQGRGKGRGRGGQ